MEASFMEVEAIAVAGIRADPAPGAVGEIGIVAIGWHEAGGVMPAARETEVLGDIELTPFAMIAIRHPGQSPVSKDACLKKVA